jgi:aminoglycoside phosphotransferase family enzyme/predicted kinase
VEPLIEALRDPARYPHPVQDVEVIETHISWVLLAGEYAYKIKKPVRLAFLDFSTLAARRHFCEEEIRLNRRTAAELYLDVVAIVQTPGGPSFAGAGTAVEYAVRMRRFAADALADRMARAGALDAEKVDALAASLAAFHAAVPRAAAPVRYGTQEQIAAHAIGNFDQIAGFGVEPAVATRLGRLRAWTASECVRLAPAFAARHADGFVRECHGDLHLGNVAFIGGRAVPFDCIEFDPALRWIDVVNEVAFLVMDLHAHALPEAAWRLLNGWLEVTGDYAGVAVLRCYLVYRAMVRAKIACLRAALPEFLSQLALAESLARGRPLALVVMHGLSGSGKTTLSQAIFERIGAVRLRSDVERKRLHGIEDPRARTGSGLGAGIYGAAAGARTYERLAELARAILQAGYPVVVDAAFLQRRERDRFGGLAKELGARFLVAACSAPLQTLSARVSERQARASDASEADAAVLAHQLATWDPLAADEERDALSIDTSSNAGLRIGVERAAARLAKEEGEHAAH